MYTKVTNRNKRLKDANQQNSPQTPPQKNKAPVNTGAFDLLSGEIGIRTPGTSRYNSFQDCRNRPLCHFSVRKITIIFNFSNQFRKKNR